MKLKFDPQSFKPSFHLKMKTSATLLMSVVVVVAATAQIPLTIKTIDEDALLEGGVWRMVDAGIKANEPYITYAQLNCESINSGSSMSWTAKDWKVKNFSFDQELNLQKVTPSSYLSTKEALKAFPLWGKNFPIYTSESMAQLAAFQSNIYTAKIAGEVLLTEAFLDQYFVLPTVNGFSYNLSTFKLDIQTIGGVYMAGFYKAKMTKNEVQDQINQCWQLPLATNISKKELKSEKGQRWIANLSNPIPGGGHVLYATSGVIDDPGFVHYIFKNYNKSEEVGQEVIKFDYMPFVKSFVLDSDQEKADYVIISTAVDYKDKSGVPKGQPLVTEYIRVDGATLKVKERFQFNSATTMWMVEKAIEKDGAVYLMGPASDSKSELIKYTTSRSAKDLPNYQIAKIEGGKTSYVSSFDTDEMASKQVKIEGAKGKFESSMILHQSDAMKAWVKDGKVHLTGQQAELDKLGVVSSFGALVFMTVSPEGDLDVIYGKPDSKMTRGDIFFTKDQNTAYWAIYDYNALNDVNGAMVIPKKVPFIAAQMSISKIDLSAKKILSTQICGEDEFAPVLGKEVLFDSDTHVAFNAKGLSKKAKESDMILVMFEK